ncbi:M104 protein [Murid betaherpesvirus 1]|uniref:M104 protein n=1 Tax=Murid herpesvirus 1 TaxID=10366 RepID=H2A0Z4_MUHV1|nr:M104 protein [Murid betaherpesvirus 1]
MWRNQSLYRDSRENRFKASDLTRSTIRSIFEADDIFRTKMLSYLDNPPEPPSDPLFPTDSSLDLFSMINGTEGACIGQTIHQILRDPSVFRKQIFYAMMRFLLNGISVGELSTAWASHRRRFVRAEDEGGAALEQFEIWADALKHTIVDSIAALLEKLIYTYAADDRYCRYVDWIVSVGVVPIAEVRTAEREKAVDAAQRRFLAEVAECHLLDRPDPLRARTLRACVSALMTREVPNVPDIRIHRLKSNGHIECFSGKRRLKRFIYAEPTILEEERLILTTPLARIRYERKRHNELRIHKKICQLLNTNPIKVVTTSRHEMNTKRIVELMEKRDRQVDAKTSIVKFLLNVSDSKSKIGLEDSVESFLQDLTPSVDQARLLPSRAPLIQPAPSGSGAQDIRELFRRQVIRCLEDQIQDHVEEIENLKLLNKTWESKTRELRDALDRYESEGRRGRGPPAFDLQTLDTVNALRRVQGLPTAPVTVDDNRVVCNSFFSQFVPDERESDERLSRLWEQEYFRCFKFRRNVTNQGAEDSISYSNYTIERVLLPFLTAVIEFPMLDAIPEEYLFLSLSELANVIYETSKLQRYTDYIRYRETIRVQAFLEREQATAAAAAAAAAATAATPSERIGRAPGQVSGPPTKIRRLDETTPGTANYRPQQKTIVTTTPIGLPPPSSPAPEVSPRFRSPQQKLETLRDRNVQHLNG